MALYLLREAVLKTGYARFDIRQVAFAVRVRGWIGPILKRRKISFGTAYSRLCYMARGKTLSYLEWATEGGTAHWRASAVSTGLCSINRISGRLTGILIFAGTLLLERNLSLGIYHLQPSRTKSNRSCSF